MGVEATDIAPSTGIMPSIAEKRRLERKWRPGEGGGHNGQDDLQCKDAICQRSIYRTHWGAGLPQNGAIAWRSTLKGRDLLKIWFKRTQLVKKITGRNWRTISKIQMIELDWSTTNSTEHLYGLDLPWMNAIGRHSTLKGRNWSTIYPERSTVYPERRRLVNNLFWKDAIGR